MSHRQNTSKIQQEQIKETKEKSMLESNIADICDKIDQVRKTSNGKGTNHRKYDTSQYFELQGNANDHTLHSPAGKLFYTFKGRVIHLLPVVRMTT